MLRIIYDDLEFFNCAIEYECIDYCDYINKKYFYADGYCLDKYSACIKFVDYILEKCDSLNINKSNIKIFKFEEKMEVLKSLINRKREEEEFDFE
ncbi:MAG: hypothetical protein IJX99_04690 [Clostridia bacterium]|nr:hypothetical protein [Clostridia bacterium]